MPLTLDDFHNLIKEVEALERTHSKDEGAMAQMLKELREKYGCKTLEEAKKKCKEAQDERIGWLKKYNRSYVQFRKDLRRYKKLLRKVK